MTEQCLLLQSLKKKKKRMSEYLDVPRCTHFFIQYSISVKNVTLWKLNVDIYLQSVHLKLVLLKLKFGLLESPYPPPPHFQLN